MKIKCANCEQKTISFLEITKSYTHRCPNCDSELLIDLNKYFQISIFTIIPILFVIGLFAKPSNLNLYISFYIILAVMLFIANLTAYTKLKPQNYKKPPIGINQGTFSILGMIIYLTLVLFVTSPTYKLAINLLGIILLIWMCFAFKKASQNKE